MHPFRLARSKSKPKSKIRFQKNPNPHQKSKIDAKNEKFDAGTILCEEGKVNGFGVGRITAVTYSPVFGHWIGLGFIKGGAVNWNNKEIVGSDPVRHNEVRIEVVSPHMYDPKGEKMHG